MAFKKVAAVLGWGGLGAGLVAFGLAGCSKDDGGGGGGSGAAAGTGGTGASPGTGGSAASGTGGGPVITDVPDAWARPADCGGVGDTCPEGIFGCQAPTSSCQVMGYVCVPAFDAAGAPSQTEETPYCAAYTCMTYEQASCFCTGEAGATVSSCASPAAMAGLCGTNSVSCETDAECCEGFACLPDRYYPAKVCRETCTDASECASGCCTDAYDTGVKVCADADECETACMVEGTTGCDDGIFETPSPCCRGTCVLSENANFAGCRPRCTVNEDCFETGCCRLFADSTEGFCVDSRYCSCGAPGQACGTSETAACCTGSTCLTFDSGATFSCTANCTTDTDCPGGCCVPLEDGTLVCLSGAYCT